MTLKLDPDSLSRLQGWRLRYFPPQRNVVPAHLTLFHTLDPEQVLRLRAASPKFSGLPPIPLRYASPRFLGAGVTVGVDSAELVALRRRLVPLLAGSLTRQDQQPFQPHVTVQNKADPAQAKVLYESFRATFQPWEGEGTGILIWRYLGGPWAAEAEIPFATLT